MPDDPAVIPELVQRAQAGDAEAFAALAEQVAGDLRRHARAIIADDHAAEDIAQDALVATWLNLPSLADPGAFPAWLRQIVRRHAYRRLRRRDVELVPLEQSAGAHDDPLDHVDQADAHATAHRAIANLPPELRDVVRLYYIRECSQRDVAAFLGLPLTIVNNRLHKARRMLKHRMLNMADTNRPQHEIRHDVGTVTAMHDPPIEVRFDDGSPANVFDALAMPDEDGRLVEAMKVARRLDDHTVLCLPTGPATPANGLALGTRLINTHRPAVQMSSYAGPIPAMHEDEVRQLTQQQHPSPELLETGIKAIDLLCPLPREGIVALAAPPRLRRRPRHVRRHHLPQPCRRHPARLAGDRPARLHLPATRARHLRRPSRSHRPRSPRAFTSNEAAADRSRAARTARLPSRRRGGAAGQFLTRRRSRAPQQKGRPPGQAGSVSSRVPDHNLFHGRGFHRPARPVDAAGRHAEGS